MLFLKAYRRDRTQLGISDPVHDPRNSRLNQNALFHIPAYPPRARARAQISHLPFFSGTSKTFFRTTMAGRSCILSMLTVLATGNGESSQFVCICMHLLAFIDETWTSFVHGGALLAKFARASERNGRK